MAAFIKSIFGTRNIYRRNDKMDVCKIELCPHESYQIEKGCFGNKLSYSPNDDYHTVYLICDRPIEIVQTEDQCFGFGNKCMGTLHE